MAGQQTRNEPAARGSKPNYSVGLIEYLCVFMQA